MCVTVLISLKLNCPNQILANVQRIQLIAFRNTKTYLIAFAQIKSDLTGDLIELLNIVDLIEI